MTLKFETFNLPSNPGNRMNSSFLWTVPTSMSCHNLKYPRMTKNKTSLVVGRKSDTGTVVARVGPESLEYGLTSPWVFTTTPEGSSK